MKFKKGRVETFIIFLLSPLLSLPFIGLQLKRRDNLSIGLISFFLGLLSYRFIPNITNDKARYYERYDKFYTYDFSEFVSYLNQVKRPDFIFEYLIYLFSTLHINIQFLFLFITSFTVYSIYRFIRKVIESQIHDFYKYTGITALAVLFSLSLQGLFSGIRFYFGVSIFIWALYYFLFNINVKKAVLLLVLSVFTHFSLSFFIPPILILYLFPKIKQAKTILIISLIFLFLPKNFLSSIFSVFELPESYNIKSEAYLNHESEVSQGLFIFGIIRNLWWYFSIGFVFFKKLDNTRHYNLVLIFTTFVNLTYSVPLIFNRYTIVLKILFLSYFLFLTKKNELKLKIFISIVFLFFLSFFIDMYVLRYNFIESYGIFDMFTIINFLSKEVNPSDFLN